MEARFKNSILLATLSTYFLIFVGGLVRVAGAGLGCPDWPKCFGHWLPPSDVSQLPPGMDPGLYNHTLAWIEYGNRLIGVLTGFFIAAAAILAITHYKAHRRIWAPTVAAAILVAFQGWQGSRVVASQLNPHVVSLHMLVAFLIVSLLVYVSYRVHFPEPEKPMGHAHRKFLLALWIVAVAQITLGTEVRATLDTFEQANPLLSDTALMAMTNYAGYAHTIIGFLLTGLAAFIGFRLFKNNPGNRLKRQLQILAYLLAAQLLSGFVLVFFGRPDLIQIVHLWLASLIVGCLVIIYCEIGS